VGQQGGTITTRSAQKTTTKGNDEKGGQKTEKKVRTMKTREKRVKQWGTN